MQNENEKITKHITGHKQSTSYIHTPRRRDCREFIDSKITRHHRITREKIIITRSLKREREREKMRRAIMTHTRRFVMMNRRMFSTVELGDRVRVHYSFESKTGDDKKKIDSKENVENPTRPDLHTTGEPLPFMYVEYVYNFHTHDR